MHHAATRCAAILLSLALSVVSAMAEEKEPGFHNVILFLADDQGWTGTSVQMDDRVPGSRSDYYRTPALEELAREGMRFSNAYAPHPNCSPTRMSIQTGKSPVRLGSTDIVDVVPGTPTFIQPFYDRFFVNKPLVVHLPIPDLPDEEITIAELIREHRPRYATAHFGKWHLNGGGPGKHGYLAHDGPTTNREGRNTDSDPKRMRGITERSLAFIEEQAGAGRPFFLQVSHYAVHTPVLARSETVEVYRSRPPGTAHTHAEYGAMTENLDESLAAVMKKLDELGLRDNTYVVYTSDNGGEISNDTTSNTPLARGKTHTWEGGIRVPMVVSGPGIEAGAISHTPVIGWDLLPTFVELLGIEGPLPPDIDGGSFAAILHQGGAGEVRRPTQDFVWYYPHYRNMKDVFPQAAIRSGDHKLIKLYETGELHLFDLGADVGEQRDLRQSLPDRARELDERLTAYLAAVGAKLPKPNPGYDPEKDLGLSSEPMRFDPTPSAARPE